MSWLKLHPKVKAAALTFLGAVLVAGAGWANGTLTQSEFVAAVVAGFVTVAGGYLKSSGDNAEGV